MHHPEENPWQITSEQVAYDNPWINVTEYQVINPSGNPGIYGKVHFKNVAIGVLALDDDLNTYLVGQFRFALGQYSWEMPEGGGPVGTDPLASAKRELLEETGYQAKRMTYLTGGPVSAGFGSEMISIYRATGLKKVGPGGGVDGEDIRIHEVRVDRVRAWLRKKQREGLLVDSKIFAGLYFVNQ